ncbi:MAG: hypothetical protein ABIQ51_25795 [Mesorhizobium sp.]
MLSGIPAMAWGVIIGTATATLTGASISPASASITRIRPVRNRFMAFRVSHTMRLEQVFIMS